MSIGSRKYKTRANAADKSILVPGSRAAGDSEQLAVVGEGFVQAVGKRSEIDRWRNGRRGALHRSLRQSVSEVQCRQHRDALKETPGRPKFP